MSVQADQRFREALRQYRAGDLHGAAELCRRLLELDAGHADGARLLAVILEASGRITEAIRILQGMVRGREADPRILYSLGRMLARTGEHARAVESLEQARRADPGDYQASLALGFCLVQVGRPDEAARQYEDALQIRPDDPAIVRAYGEILTRLTRFDDAVAAYRKALDLNAGDLRALARLAGLYERTNRLEEMAEVIEEGLRLEPDDRTLRFHRAVYLRRRDDPQAALEILERLQQDRLDPDLSRKVAFETARLRDKLGQFDKAFEAATLGNRLSRRLAREAAPDAEPFGDWLDRVERVFSAAWESTRPASPDADPALDDEDQPIFILSFPRSGTTLIEAILGARSEYQVYEEKPTMDELFDELRQHGLSYPECGDRLDAEVVGALRERYFRAANRYAERRPGSVIVDKNPLITPTVPLLQQVFPRARYIFAVRHPLDVCLSCFLYPFSPNSALAECATVEELAGVYAKVIRIWRLARRHLPLNAIELSYESLVTDFETHSRRLFEFLGITWDEEVPNFARGARTLRNHDRVIQGVYQSSRYRWKNYETQLAPAAPLVEESLSHFGYDA